MNYCYVTNMLMEDVDGVTCYLQREENELPVYLRRVRQFVRHVGEFARGEAAETGCEPLREKGQREVAERLVWVETSQSQLFYCIK